MENNADFWASVNQIVNDGFTPEGLQRLDRYAGQFISSNLYINDFHRSNSMAAQREVQRMSLHPYSREQKLMQIRSMQASRTSKEASNAERKEILSEFSEACKDIKLTREGELQGRPLEELLNEL